MPKVQITKEQILEAALQLLIEQGYEKVTIKSVAQALGCSTQPISWTFGNMENFRNALAEYALQYANGKMRSSATDPMEEYGKVGIVYIDMAYDQPNLIHFLRSDQKRLLADGGFGQSFDEKVRQARQRAFAEQYGCTEAQAGQFMLDMVIYTQGLVSMILAGGMRIERQRAYEMLGQTGMTMMSALQKTGGNLNEHH